MRVAGGTRAGALPVLASAALAVACGGGGAGSARVAFSQRAVQAYLEREAARTLPGLAVGAASCPADLPRAVGSTMSCTVVVDRVALQYEVQRLVADRFEARPQRPIVLVRDIASAVQAKLSSPGAQVRCGEADVVQPSAGQPVSCQITGAGAPRTATVQVGPDGTVTVTDA